MGISLKQFIQRTFKDEFPVFMICLVISAMIWLVIKLSEEDASLIKYPVQFVDVPEGKVILSTSSNYLVLDINLMGFDLLMQKFFKSHEPLTLSISDLSATQEGNTYMIRMPTAQLIHEVEKQLNIYRAVDKISPDTVYIVLARQKPVQN